MRIFLDTSGLIALSDEKDRNHNRAKTCLEESVQGGARFVIGKNILTEYMERLDIKTAFTFDSDFKVHGFAVLS